MISGMIIDIGAKFYTGFEILCLSFVSEFLRSLNFIILTCLKLLGKW